MDSFKQGHLSLGKGRGVCQADYLTGGDQEIPYWMAKFMFLGKAESAIRCDIKSSFADLRLSTNDSIWGPVVFFS